ncbi:hypothetical protein Tco_1508937 [Tanacetum coccineum]
MQMVGGNGGNRFRQYTRQNVGNQNRYNVVLNFRNLVVHNAVQNPRVQNVGNYNRLIVISGIANPNANQNGNGNVVAARAEDSVADCSKGRSRNPTPKEEFDLMAAARDLDEIKKFNVNCILMANL